MKDWTRVARESELRANAVRTVRLPEDEHGRPREALLLLDEHGEPRAFLNRCQHLPIPLDGGSRVFLEPSGLLRCGTHGALYRRSDGFCIDGPCAGRSLLALPLAVDADGWVLLDVGGSLKACR